jgi:hypothetical protein
MTATPPQSTSDSAVTEPCLPAYGVRRCLQELPHGMDPRRRHRCLRLEGRHADHECACGHRWTTAGGMVTR